MDKQKINDLAGKMMKGGKGAGVGAGFLALSGAVLYGAYNSFFTG